MTKSTSTSTLYNIEVPSVQTQVEITYHLTITNLQANQHTKMLDQDAMPSIQIEKCKKAKTKGKEKGKEREKGKKWQKNKDTHQKEAKAKKKAKINDHSNEGHWEHH